MSSRTNLIFKQEDDETLKSNGEQPKVMARPLIPALEALEAALRPLDALWLVGGSTGLLLQGVALSAQPRDLDIYVDRNDVCGVHSALTAYAKDEQAESETAIYRSVLSHYDMDGVHVELVGGFEVRAYDSEYRVEAQYLASRFERTYTLGNGRIVRLMPLVHELIFNVLRERPDRYEAIAAACRREGREAQLAGLADLMNRNRFDERLRRRLFALLES